MHERITRVIDAIGIKRIDFAKRLGISAPFVSELCTGAKKPSERTISDICREFNVNEEWLRTGEGEMFKQTPDSIAGQLAAEFGLDEFLQSVVNEYLKLNVEQRQTVRDFVYHVASEMPPTALTFAPAHTPTIEEEADAVGTAAREQFLMEKRAEDTSSASPSDTGSTAEGTT